LVLPDLRKQDAHLVLFSRLGEVWLIWLSSECPQQSPRLFGVSLTLPELGRPQPVQYGILDPDNVYAISSDFDCSGAGRQPNDNVVPKIGLYS
jgi:hypothetical protein